MPRTLSLFEATAELNTCYYTHPNAVIEVWEPGEREQNGLPPNRVGCTQCGEMIRVKT